MVAQAVEDQDQTRSGKQRGRASSPGIHQTSGLKQAHPDHDGQAAGSGGVPSALTGSAVGSKGNHAAALLPRTNTDENSETFFWGALAKEFRALDCRCFSLEWDEPDGVSGAPPRLFLKSADDDACLSSRMAFEALAAEAGLRIDPYSTDPIRVWLTKLIREMPRASLASTTHIIDEVVRNWTTSCIVNPCLSSDALCSSIQRQARIAGRFPGQ
jgi:hypothetical protein